MKQDTKRPLADFTNRAMQRLQDKQVPKKQQLHIPSLDETITIRSLTRAEIVECQTMEEAPGSNRADKYCIYLAMVDPDLHAVAKEIMAKEADLPADQRQLKARLLPFIHAQKRPHRAGNDRRQADPLQDGQPCVDGQRQVDGLRGGPKVDIVTTHKHQKKFQDDRRSNPDQGPVQGPILLAPTRLSLVIIHVP